MTIAVRESPLLLTGCVWLAVVCVAIAPAGADEPFRLEGFVAARGIAVDGSESWLAGGNGRFPEGSQTGAPDEAFAATLQAAVSVQLSERLGLYVHGVSWEEPRVVLARRGGITEAFLELEPGSWTRMRLRLRLGVLINPTSRENTARMWASPYAVTLSALNSWIGEEQRLTGLEATLLRTTATGSEIELGATTFGGADTLGTLLGWRGWSMGDRLVTLGETLPLPPLATLAPEGPFSLQQPGTTALDELDGRVGWAGRLRWQRPGVVLLQLAALDNRGDRGLHDRQYAWHTLVRQVGVDVHLGGRTVLVGELLAGSTGMGPRVGTRVDLDVRAWYVLLSSRGRRWRGTVRYDKFSTSDRDGTAEPNDEDGRAWTAAVFRLGGRWRLGLELVDLEVMRPAAALAGGPVREEARRITFETRVRF